MSARFMCVGNQNHSLSESHFDLISPTRVPTNSLKEPEGVQIILQQLLQVKSIMFPRDVIHPLWDVTKPPDLLILCDGSQSAFCALVYVRCELKSGGFGCRLVAGKSRVAPTRKISVPRMELQAAVMGVRLASSVVDGLRFEVGNKWFFTDNAAVLGMIRTPSGSFNEFVGT